MCIRNVLVLLVGTAWFAIVVLMAAGILQ